MHPLPQHALYGVPPVGLGLNLADACQVSPLIPGAEQLEALAPEQLASACLYAPPGTLERRYLLATALRALAVGAPLTALAPKDKGGNRLAAELEAFGCSVISSSAQHHRIVTTTRPAMLHGIDAAISAGGAQKHPSHGLWTQPGIFSWDRLDPGSALLLKHLPPLAGVGADLGCGLGVLSRAVLAAPAVTHLTLVDIDRRAVDAARRNLEDPRLTAIWADVRHAPIAPASLDFVVMNPPFHASGIEDKALGQAFITRAAELLKPGGTCWLTANRHLPYEALLAAHFSRHTRVDEADGFKIYQAEK